MRAGLGDQGISPRFFSEKDKKIPRMLREYSER